jgi:hypothetical protein
MERGSSVQQMSCVSSRWSSICCSRIDWRSLAARATMASTLGGDMGECVSLSLSLLLSPVGGVETILALFFENYETVFFT